jgi:hypothetical protein
MSRYSKVRDWDATHRSALQSAAIEPNVWDEIDASEFEQAIAHFTKLPRGLTAVIGFGGGKLISVRYK